MARIIFTLVVFLALVFKTTLIFAQDTLPGNEDVEDIYVSGQKVHQTEPSLRDLFASGFNIFIDGSVKEDAHIAGFDIEVDQDIGKNLYVAGARISIDGRIGEDLTAAGYKIRLKSGALVRGNVRVAAGQLFIDAPLSGNLEAASREIIINSTIAGNVNIAGSDIRFGDNAKILGTLTYSAPEEIEIPKTLIDKDKVEFKPMPSAAILEGLSEYTDETGALSIESVMAFIVKLAVSLIIFALIALVFLSYTPNLVDRLKHDINNGMANSAVAGVLGLSTIFGLLPLVIIIMVKLPFSVMIIVGLLLIASLILFGGIVSLLGYLLGVYAVFWRIARNKGIQSNSVGDKLMIISVGVIVLAFIKLIPVIGWWVSYIVFLIGLGAINKMIMRQVVN